ncbi:MAG: MFS transporter, partial [Archangium sp.]
LFEELPQVGDPDKPRLVFFFDEAHLLFRDAPRALLEKVDLQGLLIARFVAGAGMAAVVPAVIAWLGDALPLGERMKAATDMNSAYALGAASGVLGAGLLADDFGWASGFMVSGALALLALTATLALFVPPKPETPGSLKEALKYSDVRWLAGIAFIEGSVLFGLFAFLAPTMLQTGATAKVTGLVIAGYGVSVVVWARVAKRIGARIIPKKAMAFGGVMMVVAWSAVALSPAAPGIFTASVLMGATIVFLHAQLQVWATQAAPTSRGPGIAMFSGSLFIGASVGTALARPVFGEGHVRWLFAGGAALAGLVTATVLWRRAKFEHRSTQ